MDRLLFFFFFGKRSVSFSNVLYYSIIRFARKPNQQKRQKQWHGNQFYFSLILFQCFFLAFLLFSFEISKASWRKHKKQNYHGWAVSIPKYWTPPTIRQFIGYHIDFIFEIETIFIFQFSRYSYLVDDRSIVAVCWRPFLNSFSFSFVSPFYGFKSNFCCFFSVSPFAVSL